MKTLAFTLWLAAVSSDDAAGRMQSLKQYLDLPENERTISYPLTRCSGLFIALLRIGGIAMPIDVESELSAWATGLMREAAANIILEEGVSGSVAMDASITRTDALSKVYLSEIEGSVDEGGRMPGVDGLVPSDLRMCKAVVVEMDLNR